MLPVFGEQQVDDDDRRKSVVNISSWKGPQADPASRADGTSVLLVAPGAGIEVLLEHPENMLVKKQKSIHNKQVKGLNQCPDETLKHNVL